MKKTLSLMIILLFIVSVIPVALANGNGNNDEEHMGDLMINENEWIGKEDQATEENRVRLERVERIKFLGQESEGHNRSLFEKRTIRIEERNRFVNAFAQAKQTYLEKKERYEGIKEEINLKKEQIQSCKTSNTAECEELKIETRAQNKEFLINTADAMIQHLEEIISKTQSSEELTEEQVNEIVSEAEGYISEIEVIKENLGLVSTADEIKKLARELKEIKKEMNHRSKMFIGRLWKAKLGNLIEKSYDIEERLWDISSRLKDNGANVEDLNLLITGFGDKIDEASSTYEQAIEKLEEAQTLRQTSENSNTEEILELLKEAHELFKQTHESLKEAHNILKEIHQEIRDLREITPNNNI